MSHHGRVLQAIASKFRVKQALAPLRLRAEFGDCASSSKEIEEQDVFWPYSGK